MIFRHFWDVEARLGRVLAFREERIQKFVDTSENEPRQKCEVFWCIFKKGRMTVWNSAKSRSFVQSFEQSKGRRPESNPSKFEQDRSRSRGRVWDDVLSCVSFFFSYIWRLYRRFCKGCKGGRAAAKKCARENWVFRLNARKLRIYSDRVARELNMCKISAPELSIQRRTSSDKFTFLFYLKMQLNKK